VSSFAAATGIGSWPGSAPRRAAEVIVGDDQFKPDVGKQLFEKNIKRDRVDFMTGVVFSNIMLASVTERTRTP
jgi:branched-chain amino acid transport system substrate-binding protein